MASTFKVDFAFTQFGQGWSETFYVGGSDPTNAISVALGQAVVMAPVRVGMLGDAAKMTQVRVSDVDVLRDSAVDDSVKTLNTGNFGGSDVVQVGGLFRLYAGTKHWRNYIIRGFPDDAIIIDNAKNQMDLDQSYIDLATNWFNAMISSKFLLRVVVAPGETVTGSTPPGQVVKAKVTNVTSGDSDGATTQLEVLGATVPIPVGTNIQVRGGRKTLSALNGTWPVISSAVGTFHIPLHWPAIAGYRIADLANVYWNIYTIGYVGITGGKYRAVRTRQTGRIFDVPRGRARSRGR